MEKFKNSRLIRAIFPVITVCLLLLVCAVPARAESAIQDETFNYIPWVHGAVCATPYGSDMPTRYFHYIDYYLRGIQNTHFNVSTDLEDLQYFSVYTTPGLTMNIGGGRPRIKQTISADSLSISSWEIKLDDFAFQWNSSLFQYFMVLEGIGKFQVSFDLVWFDENDTLLSCKFESVQYSIGETGWKDGVQYWTPKAKQLISSDLANLVVGTSGVKDDQWVLVKNMYIQYWNEQSYADGNHTLTYHIYAQDGAVNWQWQEFYANPNKFWEHYGELVPGSGGVVQVPDQPSSGGSSGGNSGGNSGSSDGPTFTSWNSFFRDIVYGFLTAPVFGEVSFADILSMIVGISLVLWAIKIFGG